MLEQASVRQIRQGEISLANGFISVTMCFYPRGLKEELRDEYRSDLAPTRELFKDWRRYEAESGREVAFQKSHYEERFCLTTVAMNHLYHLAKMAEKSNVFLVCQCAVGERCHREMLLLTAAFQFGAPIGQVYHEYPTYMARLVAKEGFL